jgi:hypothetical protein
MKTQVKSLSEFIRNSHISEQLIREVVRQFGGWESFRECASDVANHGIDGGFHGFLYNADTEPFARRNRAAIAELAKQQADDFGTTVIEMIQGFGCFRDNKPGEDEIAQCLWGGVRRERDEAGVYNALAWYAGGEVCHSYVDLMES